MIYSKVPRKNWKSTFLKQKLFLMLSMKRTRSAREVFSFLHFFTIKVLVVCCFLLFIHTLISHARKMDHMPKFFKKKPEKQRLSNCFSVPCQFTRIILQGCAKLKLKSRPLHTFRRFRNISQQIRTRFQVNKQKLKFYMLYNLPSVFSLNLKTFLVSRDFFVDKNSCCFELTED